MTPSQRVNKRVPTVYVKRSGYAYLLGRPDHPSEDEQLASQAFDPHGHISQVGFSVKQDRNR